ncbi:MULTISPECIES: CPBP family intramembrane glutamic endopeptidase [Bacillus]|uniref:CPBP family intramembrane glutamic endopeptidase n=1 Tax=Bacillus TaxID=1386 RepID=UPI00031D3CCC|nr:MULTISPECIES: type II CAAX endopeptidase family protein [Bacillus]
MKKEYWYVIMVYIAMQLSGIIGAPLFKYIGLAMGASENTINIYATAYWSIFSFIVALIITLILMRKDFGSASWIRNEPPAPVGMSILWAIAGIFLAFFAQTIAANIERLIGIEVGSENTQTLVNVISSVPSFAIITSIVGPILEELIFRKIIFGSLYKKMNFILAALISSIIFGLAHLEFEHIILYTAMGFTFAFLYVKTKRIIVPIFAHVMMNTTVVIVQLMFQDQIEDMMKQVEQVQSFIGGLL